MIYICEECGFLFCRVGEIRECPSCEKHQIRPAEQEEAERLQLLINGTRKIVKGGKILQQIKEDCK